MSEPPFISQWRMDLVSGKPGVQLADVDHPLEVYVGATDLSQARMQIRSNVKPKLPSLSNVVLIDRLEQGGMWLLSLTLQDPHFNEVFVRLAAHVVERSRDQPNEKSAWLAVDSVLDEWQRLLRPRPLGVLSMDELRGLVGELWLILHRFGPDLGIQEALAGWLGPLGSPQDFWFEKSGAHEAKAVGPTATKIKFSSAEQLDTEPMELIVLEVPQVPETAGGATNLPTLVENVKGALDAVGTSPNELEMRLSRLGVKVDDPYYADIWFSVVGAESFGVTADFPGIRASALSPAVGGVRYTVERSAISPYMTASDRLD